jgi:hypothetical protein
MSERTTQNTKQKVRSEGNESRRDTSQVRENIAQTRAAMSGTIDELHGKLNPGVLKEQAVEQLHEATSAVKAEVKQVKESIESGVKAGIADAKAAVRDATIGKVGDMVDNAQQTVRDTSQSVLDAVRQNPVPTALVGVGLTWLFINARGSSPGRSRSRAHRNGHGGERVGRVMQDVTGKAGEVAQSIQRTVGDMAEGAGQLVQQAQTSLGDAGRAAGETVGEWAHEAQVQGRRLEAQIEQLFRANPLMVGAAVLAAGTAVGLAIPITRGEEALMGSARDGVLQQAENLAQGAIGKVQDVATRAQESASKVLDVASRVQESMSDRAKDGKHG